MPTRPPGEVQVTIVEGRATVEWSRPPLNIFDVDLLTKLATALHRREVREAKVVIVRGLGKGWSAGFEIGDHLAPRVDAMLGAFDRALRALWELPAPTIAEVHGRCLGGGLELLMACDLAYAADDATFSQPEVRLGVFAPFAAAYYPQALGSRTAFELMMTGGTLSAAQAAALGVVNRAVPAVELPATVALLSQTICGYRRETLRLMKRAIRRTTSDPWSHVAHAERLYREELMASPDAEEGLRAFLEKRSPVWREA